MTRLVNCESVKSSTALELGASGTGRAGARRCTVVTAQRQEARLGEFDSVNSVELDERERDAACVTSATASSASAFV